MKSAVAYVAVFVAGGAASLAWVAAADRSPEPDATSMLVPVAGQRAVTVEEPPALPPAEPSAADAAPLVEVAIDPLGATVSIRAGDRYGAGVAIDSAGAVVTAHHVVGDLTAVRVRSYAGQWQDATVVAVDPAHDLALVQLTDAGLVPPRLGSSPALRAGDAVTTVGNPRELGFSMHRGAVSFVGRSLHGQRYLQLDVSANPGNSGGPVFDADGQLVAIMSFVMIDAERIAFATPIEYALDAFADQLARERVDTRSFHAWAASAAQ